MKRGRSTKYTEAIAEEICARLAEGESLRAICCSPRMPPESTVREWVDDDRGGDENGGPGFAARYARARQHGYERMAEEGRLGFFAMRPLAEVIAAFHTSADRWLTPEQVVLPLEGVLSDNESVFAVRAEAPGSDGLHDVGMRRDVGTVREDPAFPTGLVNAELVAQGLAKVTTVPPNIKYQELFLKLQREARLLQLGLWRGASPPIAERGSSASLPRKIAQGRPGVPPQDAWTCPLTHPIKGNFTTYSGERCINTCAPTLERRRERDALDRRLRHAADRVR
jgi:hypothetical protein